MLGKKKKGGLRGREGEEQKRERSEVAERGCSGWKSSESAKVLEFW